MKDRSTIKFMTTHKIFASGLAAGLAILISMIALSPAFAFTSQEECLESVRNTEFALVKANVTNEQLNEIAENLLRIQTMCENGEFDNAASQIDSMSAVISKASVN